MKADRHIARVVACCALARVCGDRSPGAASAQEWPARDVTVVVPLGAGDRQRRCRSRRVRAGGKAGRPDLRDREPARRRRHDRRQHGRKGRAGWHHDPGLRRDGGSAALYAKLPYDPLDDFIPVISFGQQPLAVVVSPAQRLEDARRSGRGRKGQAWRTQLWVGGHRVGLALRRRAAAGERGLRGAADCLSSGVEGADRNHRRARRFQRAAVPEHAGAHPRRQARGARDQRQQARRRRLPDVPTTIEAGLPPDSVYPFYTGHICRRRHRRTSSSKLHDEIAKALLAPAVKERLQGLGIEPMPMTMEQFGKFFRDDVAANVALVKAAKIPTQ